MTSNILERHDLADAAREPVAGVNPTYPTFLCGDIVATLWRRFDHSTSLRERHAAERGALARTVTKSV